MNAHVVQAIEHNVRLYLNRCLKREIPCAVYRIEVAWANRMLQRELST